MEYENDNNGKWVVLDGGLRLLIEPSEQFKKEQEEIRKLSNLSVV